MIILKVDLSTILDREMKRDRRFQSHPVIYVLILLHFHIAPWKSIPCFCFIIKATYMELILHRTFVFSLEKFYIFKRKNECYPITKFILLSLPEKKRQDHLQVCLKQVSVIWLSEHELRVIHNSTSACVSEELPLKLGYNKLLKGQSPTQ